MTFCILTRGSTPFIDFLISFIVFFRSRMSVLLSFIVSRSLLKFSILYLYSLTHPVIRVTMKVCFYICYFSWFWGCLLFLCACLFVIECQGLFMKNYRHNLNATIFFQKGFTFASLLECGYMKSLIISGHFNPFRDWNDLKLGFRPYELKYFGFTFISCM